MTRQQLFQPTRSILIVLLSFAPFSQTANGTTNTETRRTDSLATPWVVWSLSDADWSRYQSLIRGVRGAVSDPAITPIEVLGIHARTDAERTRYAQAWAKIMLEDAERVVAFQRAYQIEIRRLTSELEVIDRRRLPARNSKTTHLVPGDRLLFFASTDCQSCSVWWSRLSERVKDGVRTDIYLAGADDEAQIRQWASEVALDPARVRAGNVTINPERGELARLAGPRAAPPILMRLRNGKATRIVLPARSE